MALASHCLHNRSPSRPLPPVFLMLSLPLHTATPLSCRLPQSSAPSCLPSRLDSFLLFLPVPPSRHYSLPSLSPYLTSVFSFPVSPHCLPYSEMCRPSSIHLWFLCPPCYHPVHPLPTHPALYLPSSSSPCPASPLYALTADFPPPLSFLFPLHHELASETC